MSIYSYQFVKNGSKENNCGAYVDGAPSPKCICKRPVGTPVKCSECKFSGVQIPCQKNADTVCCPVGCRNCTTSGICTKAMPGMEIKPCKGNSSDCNGKSELIILHTPTKKDGRTNCMLSKDECDYVSNLFGHQYAKTITYDDYNYKPSYGLYGYRKHCFFNNAQSNPANNVWYSTSNDVTARVDNSTVGSSLFPTFCFKSYTETTTNMQMVSTKLFICESGFWSNGKGECVAHKPCFPNSTIVTHGTGSNDFTCQSCPPGRSAFDVWGRDETCHDCQFSYSSRGGDYRKAGMSACKRWT